MRTTPVRAPGPAPASLPALPDLLRRPLIVGASVSADVGTLSPGKQLALKYTTPDNIHTVAYWGQPARNVLPTVPDTDLNGRTLLIGLDLFFWDARMPDCDRSLEELERLFRRSRERKLPLLVGDIPDIHMARPLPCRDVLNRALHKGCEDTPDCRVLGLDAIYQELQTSGHLRVHDHFYTEAEILPDGIHLSTVAADYLEERMIQALTRP